MPTTRSMSAAEDREERELRVLEDYPASASTNPRPAPASASKPAHAFNVPRPPTATVTAIRQQPSQESSVRLTARSTVSARIRRAELEAAARIAEIQWRLVVDIDKIKQEESEHGSLRDQDLAECSKRVNDSVKHVHTTEATIRERTNHANETLLRSTEPNQVTTKAAPRHPSPYRTTTLDRGVGRLTEALKKMARGNRSRKPSEVPPFSGAPGEWLRPEIIIDQALEELRRLPRIRWTAVELNNFAIKLQNIVTVISFLDEKGYLRNPMLARHITEKMSEHLRACWCDYAKEYGNPRDPEIVTLSRFFMREADLAVRYCYTTVVPQPTNRTDTRAHRPPPRTTKARMYNTIKTQQEKKNICYCCGAEHATPQCEKLREMSVDERWQWVKETKTCFLCINNKHRRAVCKAKKCGIEECRMPHHALLHSRRERKESAPSTNEDIAIATSARV